MSLIPTQYTRVLAIITNNTEGVVSWIQKIVLQFQGYLSSNRNIHRLPDIRYRIISIPDLTLQFISCLILEHKEPNIEPKRAGVGWDVLSVGPHSKLPTDRGCCQHIWHTELDTTEVE